MKNQTFSCEILFRCPRKRSRECHFYLDESNSCEYYQRFLNDYTDFSKRLITWSWKQFYWFHFFVQQKKELRFVMQVINNFWLYPKQFNDQNSCQKNADRSKFKHFRHLNYANVCINIFVFIFQCFFIFHYIVCVCFVFVYMTKIKKWNEQNPAKINWWLQPKPKVWAVKSQNLVDTWHTHNKYR